MASISLHKAKGFLPFLLGLLAFISIGPPTSGQTYQVTIFIQGLPPEISTRVYVDGKYNTTLHGGQSITFNFTQTSPPALHTISVDPYVPGVDGQNGVRYWAKDNSWSFMAPGFHTFIYTTQYYLRVISQYGQAVVPYGSPTGSGWYDKGSRVRARITSAVAHEGAGTRYVFTGWGGDATGSDVNSEEIIMDRPKVAVAMWKRQYELRVTTNPPGTGSPEGSGWYDEGTFAYFKVKAEDRRAEGVRYVFVSWSGDHYGGDPEGSIKMDSPKNLVAHFKLQYRLIVEFDPPYLKGVVNITLGEWYDDGFELALGPVPQHIQVGPSERLRFKEWVNEGSPETSLILTVMMDRPRRIALVYVVQYYVSVKTSYGTVVGEGWYDAGEKAVIKISYSEGAIVKHHLRGWNTSPPTTLEKVGERAWALLVDKPYVVEAVWSLDYSYASVLLAAMLSISMGAALGIALWTRRTPMIGGFAKALKGRIKRSIDKHGPWGHEVATLKCGSCGTLTSAYANYCHMCGAMLVPRAHHTLDVKYPGSDGLDEKLFSYLAERGGTISMSAACRDLGITPSELQQSIERLKEKGWIA